MTAPQRTCSVPSQLPKPAQIPAANRSRKIRRRWLTLFVIGLFVASCFVTGTPATRALLAFVPVVVLICAVELNASPGNRVRGRERWRVRRTQFDPARMLRIILLILVHVFIAWAVLLILFRTVHPKSITAEILRFGAGVALLYSVAAIISDVFSLLFLAAGYSLPPTHRTPIAARSVGEFWNRRWNILVSAWMHTYIFLPMARRHHAGLGILCAFLVSGLMHGWLILWALGAWPGLHDHRFLCHSRRGRAGGKPVAHSHLASRHGARVDVDNSAGAIAIVFRPGPAALWIIAERLFGAPSACSASSPKYVRAEQALGAPFPLKRCADPLLPAAKASDPPFRPQREWFVR